MGVRLRGCHGFSTARPALEDERRKKPAHFGRDNRAGEAGKSSSLTPVRKLRERVRDDSKMRRSPRWSAAAT